jgi:folate-binding protein YgfZ
MDLDFHRELRGTLRLVNGEQAVAHYGDWQAEYDALTASAAALDFSFRGRFCLTGNDRVRFLHGQVTNDVQMLGVGAGCYATVVNAKGRMESDLTIYRLGDELLLDFEPGFTSALKSRLEKFIVADDVQVVDVSELYALVTVQGPAAEGVIRAMGLFDVLPELPFRIARQVDSELGELYAANRPRLGGMGFDLFVPAGVLRPVLKKVAESLRARGGRLAGWDAFEVARIEGGIPRYGADMDEGNFPLEAGIDTQAVSYQKGCYIGQEVLNRIHTMGHVNRELRGLVFRPGCEAVPSKGDRILFREKESGYVTSAVESPRFQRPIALGYLRKEAGQSGTELVVRTSSGDLPAKVCDLPFSTFDK